MENKPLQVLVAPDRVKIYIDNLNKRQLELLDGVLANSTCTVRYEGCGELHGFSVKGKQDRLYQLLVSLANHFSVELI